MNSIFFFGGGGLNFFSFRASGKILRRRLRDIAKGEMQKEEIKGKL